MNYLLDTCVISEIVKPKPNRMVIDWVSAQDEDHLFLSVLTLGEIQKGISKLSESDKKKTLGMWLQTDLLERFKGRIVTVDEQVALNRGVIQATAEQNGSIIPSIDGLIAATGIAKNMTVVTRNDTGYGAEQAVIVQSMGLKVWNVKFVESFEDRESGVVRQ